MTGPDDIDPTLPEGPVGCDEGVDAVEGPSSVDAGEPDGLRELLGEALGTDEAEVLDAATAAYRGTYRSVGEYLAQTLGEYVPGFLHWIFACVDEREVLRRYEGGKLVVWTVPLAGGDVMVFESSRVQGRVAFSVLREGGRVAVRGDGE